MKRFPRLESQGQLLRWADELVRTLSLGDPAVTILELGSGNQNNVKVLERDYAVILSASGAFTLTGIAGGMVGRRVGLLNLSGQTMTIANASGSSAVENRINTPTGGNVVASGLFPAFDLVYYGGWYITSSSWTI